MIYQIEAAKQIAQSLLEIGSVKLSPNEPFRWASGLQAPIYCDNRLTLSFPKIREFIKHSFTEIILNQFKNVDIIAGVATAGIPHGVLIADHLQLPFVYVRSSPKVHGMENLIEGRIESGQKAVLIEDLISTGGSSLKAVNALRKSDVNVIGLCAIFTYGFESANEAFKENQCPFFTLSDYPTLISQALAANYVSGDDEEKLLNWYRQPEKWNG